MTDLGNGKLGEDEVEDDIIDLTDIVKKDSDPPAQDDIIELTNIVSDPPAQDDILELTNIFGDADADLELDISKLDMSKEDKFDIEKKIEREDDLSFELELGDKTGDVLLEPEELKDLSDELNIRQEQLEAALERIIDKKFADKIENILFTAMKKVIEEKIAGITDKLQMGPDQIGKG